MADAHPPHAPASGRRWPIWAYKVAGAVLAFLAVVLLSMDVALGLADDDGFEQLGAALQGLLVGVVLGALAAAAFVRMPAPARHGVKVAVLAALLAAGAVGLSVMEILDG